ncbi:SHOCT domain-containing protein [Desulfopila sp. IMCC35008]|uniref:SHOCT domain-containing protein n=1 Tax=Desulfopila sp. IMCC35008 TaxID=2653858 RepID=UPI0013D11DD5|nr:SHOCT domain-containing protein [Desulfopila sp. IMCC35008]
MWGQQFGEWGSNFCGYGPSFGHGPWFFGWLLPLFFWGAILFAIYAIAKSLFSSNKSQQVDTAFDILRNRFASGEITEKEYTAQKAVLGKR